jgi:hypothetical protein
MKLINLVRELQKHDIKLIDFEIMSIVPTIEFKKVKPEVVEFSISFKRKRP